MIDQVLQSPCSLRKAFSDYTYEYLGNKLNRSEINSISVALTVRWHTRIEQFTDYDDTGKLVGLKASGAPRATLQAMGLDPADSVTADSYLAYGGYAAVNSIDQRVGPRDRARRFPHVRLGYWGNMASLAMVMRHAKFETSMTKNEELQSWARCNSGGNDRLARAAFLRKGFEQWKRAAGELDRIAFPREGDRDIDFYRGRASLDPGSKSKTTKSWFAEYTISPDVTWSWNLNSNLESSGATLTGIRTVSSWWRTLENTKEGTYDIQNRSGRPGFAVYGYDNTPQHWTYRKYVQFGEGQDDPHLERALMRLDLTQWMKLSWNLRYRGVYSSRKIDVSSWVVDSTFGGIIAQELGWGNDWLIKSRIDKWGWGLHVFVKNYDAHELTTVVVPRGVATVMKADYYWPGTILFQS